MLIVKNISILIIICISITLTHALPVAHANASKRTHYGVYTSILAAYEKEWGSLASQQIKDMELYNVWGVPYIQVIDLNNDGIKELILVRMNKETSQLGASTQPESTALQVFTLDQGKYIKHLGSFPLLRQGLSATVQVATMGQKKYLVSGDASDAMDWQKTFWELTHMGFVKAKNFVATYTDQEHYKVDDMEIDKQSFTKLYKQWTKGLQSVVISNCTLENIEELNVFNATEKQKLAPYPAVDAIGPAAIFNEGRFLILEDTPKTVHEEIMVRYFQDFTTNNFDRLKSMTVAIDDPFWSINVEHFKNRIPERLYIPGYIIEKINTIPAAQAGHQTVLLLQNALPILKKLNLQEYVFVRAIVNEVRDLSHTSFAPQEGYGTYNYWGLQGKKQAQSPWKMYALFTDHILYPDMHANPFAVKFLGYKNDWQGMPDLSPYYTDKELATINHNDFGGEEMYVVRNKFGGETRAYEVILTDDGKLQSGKLLHTYKADELMFFSCNVSDVRPNVVLRYVAPYGAVYEYSPSTSLKDGTVNYDPYAEEEMLKIERSNFRRVF